MDFGALPPEINSARMYSGTGPVSLLAAATGWDELTSELTSAATFCAAEIARLIALSWQGPAAARMASAVALYVAWMNTTAAQAERTANQARTAAAAYTAAFAATVPPPVVTANRTLLASLVSTNVLGQHTAAIAAAEIHYAQMWAQDAAAMYGYAGAAAAASTLTPFTLPPQITNPAGLAAQVASSSVATNAQAALTALTSLLPTALQQLAAPLSSGSANSALNTLNSLLSAISTTVDIPSTGLSIVQALKDLLPASAEAVPALAEGVTSEILRSGATSVTGFAGASTAVSAKMGRAELMGALSVPQTWTAAAPARMAAMLANPDLSIAPATDADRLGGMMSAIPLTGTAGRAMASGVPDTRFLPRPPMVPRWPNLGS